MNTSPYKPAKFKNGWIALTAMVLGVSAGVWTANSKPLVESTHTNQVIATASTHSSESENQAGRLLYLSNCARCHGLEGRGDGPESAALAGSSRPRDFKSVDWKSDARAATIEQILKKGVPGTSMAAFGSTIGEIDRLKIIRYVESLAPPAARIPNNHSQRTLVQDLVARFGWQWSTDKLKMDRKLGSTERDRNEVKVSQFLSNGASSKTGLQFVQAWGVHCAICLEKLPETSEIQSFLASLGYGYQLLCVDEPNPSNVRDFLISREIKTTSLTDSDNSFKISTDLSLLPATLLVDEYGNILAKFTGVFDWRSKLQPSEYSK